MSIFVFVFRWLKAKELSKQSYWFGFSSLSRCLDSFLFRKMVKPNCNLVIRPSWSLDLSIDEPLEKQEKEGQLRHILSDGFECLPNEFTLNVNIQSVFRQTNLNLSIFWVNDRKIYDLVDLSRCYQRHIAKRTNPQIRSIPYSAKSKNCLIT